MKDKGGRIEHIPGPAQRFLNPIELEFIKVSEATKLDANHVVVVYKQNEETIQRRIEHGPCVFIPGPNEWLHEFKWHGSDPSDPAHWRPMGQQFTKLRSVPDYIYYDVKDVRTNDDTIITVKLMLFYELKDIETMLNFTHDPIADFLNAVNSDIVAFASRLTYEEFLQQTDQLNKVDSYPQLTSRAARIGYQISKVVYRGYLAPTTLQKSHEDAVSSRTNLRLRAEEEEMKQNLTEMKLKREQTRAKLARDLDSTRQEHSQTLESLKRQHALELQAMKHESQLRQEEIEKQSELEIEKAKNELEAKYLEQLKTLGVDMTKFLVNQQPYYKIHKEIIIGAAQHTSV